MLIKEAKYKNVKVMQRNFKLWNHWIAEVREIAKENKCHFTDSDGDTLKLMGKNALKWYFGKDSMFDYFEDGLTPQEAFEEEISHWEYA